MTPHRDESDPGSTALASGPPGAARPQLSVPDTEVGRLFSATDWSTTPLGPVESWPSSLRTAASLCLSSRFPIFLWGGPELVMVYNDAYVPMLGATKHPGALGRPGREVWPEIWDVIGPMLDGVMAGDGATWSDDQLLVIDRNGRAEETYFTFSYSPINDEDGGVGGVFCAVTETTDQVLAERRARTKAAVVAAVAGVVDADEVCRRAAETLRGNPRDHRSVEVVVGLPADCVTADPAVHLVPVVEPGRTTPSAHIVLTEHPHRPWDELIDQYAALCAGHVGTALSGIRRLEEERERAEALAQLDAAKSTLLANVSHELRTPLTLIAGPVEDALAERHGLPDDQRERLEVIQRNALRLRVLVDQLLDMSRIEAGTVQPRRVKVDVATLVRGLAASFQPAIERAGLTFTQECPRLPREAHLDPEMVERIVLNLLSNALKYTPAGTIDLRLRLADGGFEIVVTDTGIGIPEEELDQVFERFRQVTGRDGRRSHEGAGIGLALVQQLARLQGGRASVESVHGGGSTFTVFLPWGEEDGAADESGIPSISQRSIESFVTEAAGWDDAPELSTSAPERHAAAEGPERQSLPVLLLVEDNADMRRYVSRSLADDYRVVSVRDGVEALERVREVRPDIVLADVMMPRLDGLGLTEALRAESGLSDIPIVLLSARVGVEASADGLARGADDYIAKPFDGVELRARLAANLTRARGRSRDAAWRRAVMGSLHEPLIITDRDGLVIELNDAFTRTYGWSTADGPFTPPYPWRAEAGTPTEDRALRRIAHFASGEGPVEELFPVVRRDGSRGWVALTASLIPEDADHPALVVGVARDWTREHESQDRRALAARLATELAKGEDLEQVIASAVTGFSVLFDGSATVRVTAGRQDLVLTPTGTATLAELDPPTRAALEAEGPTALAVAVASAEGADSGDDRAGRGGADGPRRGLLLMPTSTDSHCRAWVEFASPRVVPSDELIVGDLLAQTFSQAVGRVIAQRDRSEQDAHFQRAVESHRLIGNAVGVLIERHKVTAAQGFEMLRQASLNRNIKLREIALRVVETGMEPSDTA